jgi:hypothetical protein
MGGRSRRTMVIRMGNRMIKTRNSRSRSTLHDLDHHPGDVL